MLFIISQNFFIKFYLKENILKVLLQFSLISYMFFDKMPQKYVDPKTNAVDPYPEFISMHGSILLPSFMLLTKSA